MLIAFLSFAFFLLVFLHNFQVEKPVRRPARRHYRRLAS